MTHRSRARRARTGAALCVAAVLGATGLVPVGAAPALAVDDDDVLTTDERLEEGDRLVSPSGRYALEILDGELLLSERANALVPERQLPLYDGVGYLLLQQDGNLVVFSPSGAVLDSSATGGTGATAVRVQDDRNIVFSDDEDEIVADLGTARAGFLDVDEAMLPDDVVDGEDGTTRLIMQGDGNLVLYRGSTPLWDSRTAGNPGAAALLQADGNLVVYSADLRPLYSTGTRSDAALLRVEDTELSVVAFDGPDAPYSLWASSSRLPGDPRGTVAVVASGDELDPGEFRVAGSCRLVMQTDGNLVQYCGAVPVFASRTSGPSLGAFMQADGNLVVYSADGSPSFATRTSGAGNALVLQTDTNLVVYGPGGRARWSRVTGLL